MNEVYNKAIKVIESCTTTHQVLVADRYIENAAKFVTELELEMLKVSSLIHRHSLLTNNGE